MGTNENELVRQVTARLGRFPGVSVHHIEDETLDQDEDGWRSDLLLEIATSSGRQIYRMEIKRRVTPSVVETVVSQLRDPRSGTERPLLVTDRVTDPVAEALVERELEFVDAAGNAYLDGRAGYVLVLGRKGERSATRDPFTPTGLRVVYALLTEPALRKGTYREIAQGAGVSLGSVGYALKALRAEGHLIEGGSGELHLADERRLRERWELGYAERLRPALEPSACRGPPDMLDDLVERAEAFGAMVSGEVAAARMGLPLRPQSATIHVPSERRDSFVKACKLLAAGPDAEPQVYLLDPVAGKPEGARSALADALLVRAELLAIGDERLREIADEIRDGRQQDRNGP